MPLLFVRMLQELTGNRIFRNALGHVVVALIAQNANDLGRERRIQYGYCLLYVAFIIAGYRTAHHILARAPAQLAACPSPIGPGLPSARCTSFSSTARSCVRNPAGAIRYGTALSSARISHAARAKTYATPSSRHG